MKGDDRLKQARESWRKGEPIKAGRLIVDALDKYEQCKWAFAVLEFLQRSSPDQDMAIQALLDIQHDPREWHTAKQIFSLLRKKTLELESMEILNTQESEGLDKLYIAENIAKIVYNATDPPDQFDEDSAYWVFECVQDWVNRVPGKGLKKTAWEILSNAPNSNQ